MKRIASVLLVVAVGSGAAACRQPDGPMPVPGADRTDDLSDVSKDLLNVSSRVQDSPQELAHDLVRFAQEKKAEAPANDLGLRVGDALAGSKLSAPDAQKLAGLLWTTITAPELSDRQRDALAEEVKTVLVTASVPDDRTQPVLAQIEAVQKTITIRKRRWYEVF